MEAMDYEFLLRRVYNCARHGVKGADADIYRKMDMAQRHLDDPNWGKSKEQKEHDFYSAFIRVKDHVAIAINKGISQIDYKATEEEINTLKAMLETLRKHNFYNKEKLDDIIDDADEIFRKHGLEGR